jgi:hypothetical protein
VKDDDDARLAAVAAQPFHQSFRLPRRQRSGGGARKPRHCAVANPRWVNGNDGRGAQEVLGLLSQDELLQLACQQQHADRLPLVR